ncbi:MAG TPA: peptidase S10 [Roseiflexaceae bacterium]|nr:peptidase S10 [Roseiflexaceae bacterium]
MAGEPRSDTPEQQNNAPAAPQDVIVQTAHAVTIAGRTIQYTVTTGTIVLKEEAEQKGEDAGKSDGEKPRASVFFIAYTRDDTDDPGARPLTFSFNGGPGSSSVWLHLGVLGPRRVLLDQDGNMLPPPFRLVENEYSLLDETDLVFIDPVSTGYSRPVQGEKAKQFHAFTKDIESVGDFIRLYTSRYQRWNSPKFLIGESYGTTRAGGLAGYLQERHSMYLNGIMLVSSILNFQTARFNPGNDLPYILILPTYTATAWYHKRLDAELQADLRAALDEVEDFALGDYTLALMKGDALPAEERARIAQRLARYTGLSVEYVERCNLRIEIMRFTKELLREQRLTVGRLDSRFKGVDRDAAGERFEFDPSLSGIMGPYSATFNHYVRADLGFASDLPYEILTGRVHPWSYGNFENRYVDVSETLRQAMCVNPFLKVFIASGYYDLATPYYATDYTVNHLQLEPEARERISTAYYEAGHMMYVHIPSLARLKDDLAGFIRRTLSE